MDEVETKMIFGIVMKEVADAGFLVKREWKCGFRKPSFQTLYRQDHRLGNLCHLTSFDLRACLHGGGGPQVGEVTRFGGVTHLSIQSLMSI